MPDSRPTATVEPDGPDDGFWASSGRSGRPPELPPRVDLDPWGGAVERFVDRLRDLRGDSRAGIAALIVVALVAGFVWYRLGAGGSADSSTTRHAPVATTPDRADAGTRTTGTANGTRSAKKGRVMVHVAGAVAKPGVYELDGRARVIDAVEAAGGGAPDADLDRLNLAAKVTDGQRVLVQRAGKAAAPGPAGTPGSGSSGGADPSGLVNLNSATQPELEALPGVGPSLAQAIIAERERRGGFRSVNELRDVRGIGDKRFADLKDKVTI